ncbi:hypothetical protein F5J12DRAFT_868177 [Pisolithus orientalis]|uniref:uncharacterized protein n=1 Tax=Pisolithus orientalis TaxID=936130 RepID=UPI00222553ED|nr:uncharacterized protein F5J12DRAFT_868177 [Pisolithus orientalis]KAI5986761.1 hypothetical protein F5J12DRAFT_868177 [Pisolithus orientalis]
MYLLNARTQKLEHFLDLPPYAILSHAWQSGEAHRFHEIGTPGVCQKPGYDKVQGCCTLALQHGLDYVWIDTCCADANSITAFDEALNSSYAWFNQAAVCFVYLHDVESRERPEQESSTFRRSKWFSRAWTLQELLAPGNVFFFAKDWKEIGTKAGLASVISSVTGIHTDALMHPERVPHFSVATRMSWAKGRKSSKPEDRVYALMGLFGVNLPIVYGQGETETFMKLQHEIIKKSDDQSILAWRFFTRAPSPRTSSFLADSPDYFADCGDVHRIPSDQLLEYCIKHSHPTANPRSGFLLTCRGLQATLPVRSRRPGVLDALLACARGPGVWNGSKYAVNLDDAEVICIRLRKPTPGVHPYERMDEHSLEAINIRDAHDFVLQDVQLSASQRLPTRLDS